MNGDWSLTTPMMGRKRILIADDNENIRDALAYLLEDEGFQLWIAKDGVDALQKARDMHPDILLLDIMMPKMNGYDVCRAIKKDPELKNIYIIMLTAKGQVAEQERGKEVGANEYVVKPFSPSEILVRIKKILK
jgi:two-component system alkaline phosphatase synthesis response regulator PhoP